MKLIQLNCWGGKLNTPLTKFFSTEMPDFVTLQEATNLRLRPGSVLVAPEVFLPKDDYPYSVFAPVFSYQYMHELAELGNAIISQIEPSYSTYEYTAGGYLENMESLRSDDYNIRNFAHAKYIVSGKMLNIITHHGHHDPNSKEGSEENTKQLETIGAYIDALEDPVILAGDLNLHPKSKSLKPLQDRLRNLCVEFEIESTRNELAKRTEVIDYVFVSKDIKVNKFSASDVIISDHKALILEFDL